MGNAMYYATLGEGTHRATGVDEVEINTASDLYDIRDNSTLKYIQTAHIDLSGYADWDPICHLFASPFTGEYDGNGYAISNLTMSNPTLQGPWIGLFGNILGSTMTNIVVLNANINIGAGLGVGLIAGYSETSLFTKCRSTGIINNSSDSGENSESGGLVGWSEIDEFSKCSSLCVISNSGRYTGGLIGFLDESYVHDCYYYGELTGYDYIGGLTGECFAGTIDTTYTAAILNTSGTYIDAFVGKPNGYTLANSYYDSTITDKTSIVAFARTTTQLKDKTTYFGSWNFIAIWDIRPYINDGYPFLRGEYYPIVWKRIRNIRHLDTTWEKNAMYHLDSVWKRVNI